MSSSFAKRAAADQTAKAPGLYTPGRAALAGWIGGALEYYDFFAYGMASGLVFNRIFFSDGDPATGFLMAMTTLGLGYLARPVGAFFLGHIGDTVGRRTLLVVTLVLMGLSTFLVGCLPTFDQIGMGAPILLVMLRLCQGISLSGEQASANAFILEHAPNNRRAFFTSFALSGYPLYRTISCCRGGGGCRSC